MSCQVLAAVSQTIQDCDLGWSNPATINVYVGSHDGVHRAVSIVELLGKSLRSKLRANEDNKFTVSVSVETKHRDIDKRKDIAKEKDKDEFL